MRIRRLLTLAVVMLTLGLAWVLGGCTAFGPDPGEQPSGGPTVNGDVGAPETTLSIVAGSEQQSVLTEIVLPWCRAQGYSCNWRLLGSVDQARLLQSGGYDNDAFWFASSVFSQMGNTSGALRDSEPMFLTPIVFAARPAVLARLGLGDQSTAEQVMAATESGKARVWATNPTQSNSGATVLFSFLNIVAGNPPGQALTHDQLNSTEVVDGMRRFFAAIDRTPPSTGTMTSMCVAAPDECEAMFTYEDLVIEKNAELAAAGQEPLHVVYPRGALGISDAPLGFVDHGQEGADAKYRIFTELKSYLTTDPAALTQLLAMGRRPAAGVGLAVADPDPAVFNPDWGIQADIAEQGVTFPAADVITEALDHYHTAFRRPADIYYCLDGSGSMGGNGGWSGVQSAATALFDPEEAARNLLQTAPDDRTTVAVFNDRVSGGPWRVDGNADADLSDLEGRIRAHSPDGGTDMYVCLDQALDSFAGTDRKRLIVVMSDGQSSPSGSSAMLAALRQAQVPVIAIAFGDVDPTQLRDLADASGGAYVENSNLVAALREAAGYK